MYIPSLVLIAQVGFLLERGRIDRQTDKSQTPLITRPTHGLLPAWVWFSSWWTD